MYSSFVGFINKKFNTDAHYFLHGGFWLTLTQGVVVVSGIITTALLANYLSPTSYGVYRYLIGLAIIFSSFSLTGLGQSILQTAAKKYYGFYAETIKINLVYSLGITAAAVGGAVYYFVFKNPTLAIGCLLIALFQPIINIYQYTPAFLQGSNRFKESTIIQSTRAITTSLISIGVLLITKSIVILFVTYLLSNALISFVTDFTYKLKVSEPTDKKILNKYISYAKHTSVRNIVASISNRLDTVLVFTQLGAAELAIYSIATIIPEQIKGSFKNLANLLLPKYAKQEDISSLKVSVVKRSLQLFVVLTVVMALYIVVAPYLYQILFPTYHEAILFSQISALAFPTFILLIPYSVLQSQLAEAQLHRITLYSSLFQILTLVGFIFAFGLLGAIIAKIVYRVFLLILTYAYLNKKT